MYAYRQRGSGESNLFEGWLEDQVAVLFPFAARQMIVCAIEPKPECLAHSHTGRTCRSHHCYRKPALRRLAAISSNARVERLTVVWSCYLWTEKIRGRQ